MRKEVNADLFEQIRKNGTSFTMYAEKFQLYTQEMCDSMIGQITKMNAHQFGVDETWNMKVTKATLLNNGAAVHITMIPVEE